MRITPSQKIMIAIAAVGAAATASASVDTSPKPGGVFRLKPGTYARKGVECGSATVGSVRRYDGRGISMPHGGTCRARIISRHGDRYDVKQTCTASDGKPIVSNERQVITVPDALTFTLATQNAGSGVSYRYCPAYMLPANLTKFER
jgi:hypothetical protein